ncbi:M1 family aminopeptidase [Tenacibaculum sp. SG-28]|uniref:M1 family aminopeptidase n=1 Tax=Tenacibaculum sp. SG-28 TaxID=754426 RepID=UPI0011B0242E|nr:M1 family aminopeptidase [Tenacibaculum sp. SG-28]
MILILISSLRSQAQNNSIQATIELKDSIETLYIHQKIVYHNKTGTTLKNIYLHDWANSFKNNETPLAKRFLDDYQKRFYFSNEEDRGFTRITKLLLNNKKGNFYSSKEQPDIINIDLNENLPPKDSVTISMAYRVKIPNSAFTGYGKTAKGYHLRFWQIIPAVYQNGWQLMSNLNMDDLYQDIANYRLEVKIPIEYRLESNLYQYRTPYKTYSQYYLIGNNKKDIILSINKEDPYISIKLKTKEIKTDAYDEDISKEQTNAIIRKQINFIESYIGKVPFTELFIDKTTINKNTLHEIYGLPDWLKPFPENFKWEINFFHSLCSKYINNLILHNKRVGYWFSEGLQTYLMMEYLEKYYPETTLLGKYSAYWPLKNYNISKLKQADKYTFVYQFSARRFLDQALNTSSDSLSNFNRKVVSRYKAGLGLKYLHDYIGKDTLQRSLKQYLRSSNLRPSSPDQFLKILENNTTKDIGWFKDNYLKTSKKIDYTITNVKKTEREDSLKVTIKNKRTFAAPVAIYGIDDKKIKYKKWIPPVDSTATITIKNDAFSKIALNYENIYPEYNSLDNFRTVTNNIINKPLQFKLFKDIEDPYYHQLFYLPTVKYNLYDGLIVGLRINNRPLITHNFKFTIEPNYGIKSQEMNGFFLCRTIIIFKRQTYTEFNMACKAVLIIMHPTSGTTQLFRM